MDEVTESILRAAVKRGEEVFSLSRPARHGHILRYMTLTREETEQGFITSEGRFVSRLEAGVIALAAGQISQTSSQSGALYTEDLW